MSDIYIPPEGISFRLLGYLSQCVLFSRTNAVPEVWHIAKDSEYPDQWFQLIPGVGKFAGYYIVKSKYTGKVLYSRGAEPLVGHIDGDGMFDDNWFKIEAGEGKYAQNFRLRNFCTDTVIFSRLGVDPEVSNITASAVYADQYFTFLFEDMKVDKIEYDLKSGKIVSSIPKVLAIQSLDNATDIEQEMAFELNVTETHTSTFAFTSGFTATAKLSFSVGLPVVASLGFEMETSQNQEWKFGTQYSHSKTCTVRLPAKASPHTTVIATSSVNSGDIAVPFTIYLSSKSTGVQVETHGTYHGLTTWDLRHSLKEKLIGQRCVD